MTTAYLNGQFLPLAEAKVPVLDRGFLFGDGVYEVIPVYQGHLFRLKEHLTRLANSLKAIELAFNQDLTPIIEEIIKRNGLGDQSVYLQITRGAAPQRDHLFPETFQPTVLIFSVPLLTPNIEKLRQGISAITLADTRWQRCNIKAITLLANVLLRQQAKTQGAQEAILIREGFALEGSASNLFIVENRIIITPPLTDHILGGITRDVVLELAKQERILYREQDITEQQLLQAEEIWITSSTREIMPVITLNNTSVGQGKPGPIWEQMIAAYQTHKAIRKS